jgi:hypothetical protein
VLASASTRKRRAAEVPVWRAGQLLDDVVRARDYVEVGGAGPRGRRGSADVPSAPPLPGRSGTQAARSAEVTPVCGDDEQHTSEGERNACDDRSRRAHFEDRDFRGDEPDAGEQDQQEPDFGEGDARLMAESKHGHDGSDVDPLIAGVVSTREAPCDCGARDGARSASRRHAEVPVCRGREASTIEVRAHCSVAVISVTSTLDGRSLTVSVRQLRRRRFSLGDGLFPELFDDRGERFELSHDVVGDAPSVAASSEVGSDLVLSSEGQERSL